MDDDDDDYDDDDDDDDEDDRNKMSPFQGYTTPPTSHFR